MKAEKVENMTLFGHFEKRFCSKSRLEASVKSFVQNLGEKKELLRADEVDSFLKRKAFDVRWCEK